MQSTPSNARSDTQAAQRKRLLRLHLMVFAGAGVVLFAADWFMAGPLWFHWPVMVWGAVAGVHFLYCKSVDVDDDWADRRATDVRLKSYDLGHIRAIDKSFENGPPATHPAPEDRR